MASLKGEFRREAASLAVGLSVDWLGINCTETTAQVCDVGKQYGLSFEIRPRERTEAPVSGDRSLPCVTIGRRNYTRIRLWQLRSRRFVDGQVVQWIDHLVEI